MGGLNGFELIDGEEMVDGEGWLPPARGPVGMLPLGPVGGIVGETEGPGMW